MKQASYDISRPRFSVCNLTMPRLESPGSHLTHTFETLSRAEAMWWARLGYTVDESWYDPATNCFSRTAPIQTGEVG